MRFRYWIITAAFIALVSAKETSNSDDENDAKIERTAEETLEENESGQEKVGTISADLKFNSWRELYDYLKEIEEEVGADEGEDVEGGIQLQLMTDGDALTLEGDNNEGDNPVIVEPTISDVIREVPAPDLTREELLAGDEEVPQKTDKPRIVATETDWTFIQDTLMKLDNKETTQAKRAKYETEPADQELTEDEKKGKAIYQKAKQITTVNRANRRQAYQMFSEAAELGYTPAREQVAWLQLLGSQKQDELMGARKVFEELAELGRPNSQMVKLNCS